MSADGPGELSLSFVKLQRLAHSFDVLGTGAETASPFERTMVRIARKLGTTAVPLCLREIASPHPRRAAWAATLLQAIAGEDADPAARARTVAGLRRVSTPAALGLLAELGEPMPAAADPADVGAAHADSIQQLAACLDHAPDIARAVDLLLLQLDPEELLAVAEEVTKAEPRRALRLCDEIILRPEVCERLRSDLKRVRAPLAPITSAQLPRRAQRRGGRPAAGDGDESRAVVSLGRHCDGHAIFLVSRRSAGRPARWRAMCILVDPDGRIADGLYRDDVGAGGVRSELLVPLAESGYDFATAAAAECAPLIAAAARRTIAAGGALPRAYYLGRDLFGLHDEHLLRRDGPEDELAALHARALDLLARGETSRARPLLARYVAHRPDDAPARSSFGLCLLRLGDADGARRQLERAAALAPDVAIHRWNLASVAHRTGRRGAAYLSLCRYLARRDDEPGADARARTAHRYVADYERAARLEHPGSSPRQVARADEAYLDALARLDAGATDDAITRLRRAVRSVPSHYRSWTRLAAVYADADRLAAAERCLARALAARPDDPTAAAAMVRVTERRRTLTPRGKARTGRRRRSYRADRGRGTSTH